jgi:hypothetical protein
MIGILWIVFCTTLATTGAEVVAAQQQDQPQGLPAPAHVIVVIEENEPYTQIIGSSQAPYINGLAAEGALFTNSHAITHPSEPNYLALFSGSTQGITNDSCPLIFSAANLGSELIAAGKTFTGFSEGLPSGGSGVCSAGKYARKHVPWPNFSNLPASANQPFTSFPANFADLPTISFVIPNLMNDMHDGTVLQADNWLKSNLANYVAWARSNNSLLIITWDEDNDTPVNQIPTIFLGPMVKPGKYSEKIDHYSVLRTLEAMYGLRYVGQSASAETIKYVWK